jgi:hypothetical protein
MAEPAGVRSVDAMLQSTTDLGAQPVIQTVGLTKHYGPTLALDRLDLTIQAGEVYGFWAPTAPQCCFSAIGLAAAGAASPLLARRDLVTGS